MTLTTRALVVVCGVSLFGAGQQAIGQLPTPLFPTPTANGFAIPNGCGSPNSYGRPANFQASGIESVAIHALFGQVAQQVAGVDFSRACDRHDICYGTLWAPKLRCDERFLHDLHRACAAPESAYPLRCHEAARGYWLALWGFGSGPYLNAQMQSLARPDLGPNLFAPAGPSPSFTTNFRLSLGENTNLVLMPAWKGPAGGGAFATPTFAGPSLMGRSNNFAAPQYSLGVDMSSFGRISHAWQSSMTSRYPWISGR